MSSEEDQQQQLVSQIDEHNHTTNAQHDDANNTNDNDDDDRGLPEDANVNAEDLDLGDENYAEDDIDYFAHHGNEGGDGDDDDGGAVAVDFSVFESDGGAFAGADNDDDADDADKSNDKHTTEDGATTSDAADALSVETQRSRVPGNPNVDRTQEGLQLIEKLREMTQNSVIDDLTMAKHRDKLDLTAITNWDLNEKVPYAQLFLKQDRVPQALENVMLFLLQICRAFPSRLKYPNCVPMCALYGNVNFCGCHVIGICVMAQTQRWIRIKGTIGPDWARQGQVYLEVTPKGFSYAFRRRKLSQVPQVFYRKVSDIPFIINTLRNEVNRALLNRDASQLALGPSKAGQQQEDGSPNQRNSKPIVPVEKIELDEKEKKLSAAFKKIIKKNGDDGECYPCTKLFEDFVAATMKKNPSAEPPKQASFNVMMARFERAGELSLSGPVGDASCIVRLSRRQREGENETQQEEDITNDHSAGTGAVFAQRNHRGELKVGDTIVPSFDAYPVLSEKQAAAVAPVGLSIEHYPLDVNEKNKHLLRKIFIRKEAEPTPAQQDDQHETFFFAAFDFDIMFEPVIFAQKEEFNFEAGDWVLLEIVDNAVTIKGKSENNTSAAASSPSSFSMMAGTSSSNADKNDNDKKRETYTFVLPCCMKGKCYGSKQEYRVLHKIWLKSFEAKHQFLLRDFDRGVYPLRSSANLNLRGPIDPNNNRIEVKRMMDHNDFCKRQLLPVAETCARTKRVPLSAARIIMSLDCRLFFFIYSRHTGITRIRHTEELGKMFLAEAVTRVHDLRNATPEQLAQVRCCFIDCSNAPRSASWSDLPPFDTLDPAQVTADKERKQQQQHEHQPPAGFTAESASPGGSLSINSAFPQQQQPTQPQFSSTGLPISMNAFRPSQPAERPFCLLQVAEHEIIWAQCKFSLQLEDLAVFSQRTTKGVDTAIVVAVGMCIDTPSSSSSTSPATKEITRLVQNSDRVPEPLFQISGEESGNVVRTANADEVRHYNTNEVESEERMLEDGRRCMERQGLPYFITSVHIQKDRQCRYFYIDSTRGPSKHKGPLMKRFDQQMFKEYKTLIRTIDFREKVQTLRFAPNVRPEMARVPLRHRRLGRGGQTNDGPINNNNNNNIQQQLPYPNQQHQHQQQVPPSHHHPTQQQPAAPSNYPQQQQQYFSSPSPSAAVHHHQQYHNTHPAPAPAPPRFYLRPRPIGPHVLYVPPPFFVVRDPNTNQVSVFKRPIHAGLMLAAPPLYFAP